MKVLRFADLVAQGRVSGQRVFIRADLNVPQDAAGRITEDTRIRASLPCIRMALDAGAAVMLTSHLGRPTEGEFRPEDSLAPVAERLAKLLGAPVPLKSDWIDGVDVRPGELVLLENCRLNKGEKKNCEQLATKMAALTDIFVHDAFGTAHRAEASTYGIAQFAKLACAGPLLAAEIDAITQALLQPKRPLVAIVAGSKVSSKLSILRALAQKVDGLVVGGGIANTFLLAQGLPIGKSLAEPDLVDEARAVIALMRARGAEVPVPIDVVCAKEFRADAAATVKAVAAVESDDLILDIGPQTAALLAARLEAAGTIVWNGPVGVFEFDAFAQGTEAIARAVTRSRAFSIAGGGDTLAAIAKYGIERDVGYMSTGGGAFLELLEGKTLPAFEILERRAARGGSAVSHLQALLWDVDGTIAETERDGHRIAFNRAFEACGLPWRWDVAHYGELLRVTGGRERLMHDMGCRPDAPPLAGERDALARALHAKKNALYAELVAGAGIALRDGVLALMRECREQGLRMAIATTTSRANVEALLGRHLGPRWADGFAAIVCGEDVLRKKPDPEVFVRALQQLGLGPLQTIAIEDSPGGVAAARAAHCPVVVTRSIYFADAQIDGALAIGPGLHTRAGWRPSLPASSAPTSQRVGLADLVNWFSQHDTVYDYP